MSTRGLNFKFSVGEVVLCFEPDPSKAHVLYEAKILECQFQKDRHGSKVPGYLVHFQGWNSSWDRVVGEHYILKNTEENQDLMRRLADTARKQKNSQRRRKIKEILRETFGVNVPGYSSNIESSETEDSEDGENSCDRRYSRDRRANDEKLKVKKTQQKQMPIELDIPEVLKMRLEDDYYLIEHQKKLTKLPAKPSVVDVLESYMKTFCINALCDPVDREREKTRCTTGKDALRLPPHNSLDEFCGLYSINLCRELVDGLRVCFDFTLPQLLLYGREREQYTNLVCALTPTDLKPDKEEKQHSTRAHPGKRRATHDPVEESEPKTATRRMTRRSHIESAAPSENHTAPEEVPKSPTASSACTKPAEKSAAKPTKRSMARIRRRLENPWDPPSAPIKQEPMSDVDVEAAPPATCSAPAGSAACPAVPWEGQGERKEDMMESILSWQILPPETRAVEVTPSQVYGVFHLLRMFVKLPELLSAVQWDEQHSQIQVKLLNHCLQFLMERQEELFNGVVYEDV